MIAEAKEARTDPSKLPSFKALRLNMGGSDVMQSYLMEAADWQRIEADVARTGPFILGIDLGDFGSAMSAAAGYWPASGRLESIACFPEEPGLAERGLADGVGPIVRRTFLTRGESDCPWKVGCPTSVDCWRKSDRRWGHPLAIACDRWREAELRDCLES